MHAILHYEKVYSHWFCITSTDIKMHFIRKRFSAILFIGCLLRGILGKVEVSPCDLYRSQIQVTHVCIRADSLHHTPSLDPALTHDLHQSALLIGSLLLFVFLIKLI